MPIKVGINGFGRIGRNVPRLYARLLGERDDLPLGVTIWDDTAIELPRGCAPTPLQNLLDGSPLQAQEREDRHVVLAGHALVHFPVALLSAMHSPDRHTVEVTS